jgi:methionyl-tRNA synthetase
VLSMLSQTLEKTASRSKTYFEQVASFSRGPWAQRAPGVSEKKCSTVHIHEAERIMPTPSSQAPTRPPVPTRAVITGGMPYGNKELHFGHVGGMFVQADAFARFLRDRIGKENVLFVSGTDCYGSPIVESHRVQVESGQFTGTLEEFVAANHAKQKSALDAYGISLDFFGTSGLGRARTVHTEMCGAFFQRLKENGHLKKAPSSQFFDPQANALLNGRQVVGRCPVPGCKSEKAYADECSLGHPYEPSELLEPKSTLTGATPELRTVENWYIDLEKFRSLLWQYTERVQSSAACRPYAVSGMREFLEPPTLHVKGDNEALLNEASAHLPPHTRKEPLGKGQPIRIVFASLAERETAAAELTRRGVRFRAGKTLVPFRLTGNVEWGLPAPSLDGLSELTFWVWPESLWAPLSFTATLLETQGKNPALWKQWWCSRESSAFQFIGEDNLYFYGLAEMGLFLGDQGPTPAAEPPEGALQLPHLVVNNHILFFDKKASSSGAIKPPLAHELLDHYTADQLRAHFLALGLGLKSVGFKPKPLNPDANDKEGDPVMKEGNLLCNAFNKAVRTCFHTAHKSFEGRIPEGRVSDDVLAEARTAILAFESAMLRHVFHEAMAVVDNYTRSINKRWTTTVKPGTELSADDPSLRQVLVDVFYMVKVATVLLHPIAPFGTERIREYLGVGEELWSWQRIFDPLPSFFPNPETHTLKVLEARVDFFPKHPSQLV